MNLQTLIDQRDITHALGTFARILDGRQWPRVSEVFADDVTFEYGLGEKAGIAALIENFSSHLDPCGPSQHLLGSIQVEVDGDSAVSRAYVQARHIGAGDRAHLTLDSNGEYIDQWQRRTEGWRVVRRDVRWFHQIGDYGVFGAELEAKREQSAQ